MATEPVNMVAALPDSEDGAPRSTKTTLLAALLQKRSWHRYGVFRVEYEQAARSLDRALIATTPSRAQWHRWLAGELRRLPHVDHCRVLEAMFPGRTVAELMSPVSDARDSGTPGDNNLSMAGRWGPVVGTATTEPYADLAAVFPSRTEFMANLSPLDLFCRASRIRASGLSLNMLCQNLADQQLRRLLEEVVSLQALFLQPDGEAIRRRESEEGLAAGSLSTLTRLNIDMLLRARDQLDAEAHQNVVIGTYDETIRFNITLIEDELCVAQPYLSATRGVDSPTFVIRRDPSRCGLYDTFDQTFRHLAEQSIHL